MAYTPVGVGTVANDNTGDPIRTAFQAINANFVLLDTVAPDDATLNIILNDLVGTEVNGNIDITPNGTGNIVLGTITIDADQTAGGGQTGFALVADGAGVMTLTLLGTAAQGALADTAVQIVTSTTAALAASGNAINTSADKVAGYEVFDTTIPGPVWAVGATPTSIWVDGAGLTVHSPA